MLDATGAGDAYVAAMIARLLGTHWPPDATTLRDAMERGTRDGGLVARVVGAQGRTGAEALSR
jgi:sugar/nucleoside kinase (ribokinase family)